MPAIDDGENDVGGAEVDGAANTGRPKEGTDKKRNLSPDLTTST
jgi:hypothetical protein